jgi:replication-associated recombination protein RarA
MRRSSFSRARRKKKEPQPLVQRMRPCQLGQLLSRRTLLGTAMWLGHRFHHAVKVEAAWLLARRELAKA